MDDEQHADDRERQRGAVDHEIRQRIVAQHVHDGAHDGDQHDRLPAKAEKPIAKAGSGLAHLAGRAGMRPEEPPDAPEHERGKDHHRELEHGGNRVGIAFAAGQ